MLDYRLYVLNQSGHVVDAAVLHCPDDRQAIDLALQAAIASDVELWLGDRKIKYIQRRRQEA